MHIIGIYGKQNTGKSTVAEYLKTKGYIQFAFADIIKEIISIMTG